MNGEDHPRPRCLASFLGTGEYRETEYLIEGARLKTPYVALALARRFSPRKIVLLGTPEAKDKHLATLTAAFGEAKLPQPEFHEVPAGRTESELWQLFLSLVSLLGDGVGTVLLDVTHGFRAQPVFAAAVVSFLRAMRPTDEADPSMLIRVFYGAYDPHRPEETPVWELSALLEVVDWSHAVRQFLSSGDARTLAMRSKSLARLLGKRAHDRGERGSTRGLRALAQVLERFSKALSTLRIRDLLLTERPAQRDAELTRADESGKTSKSSRDESLARQLLAAIAQARHEVVQQALPLAPLLDELARFAEELNLGQDHLGGTPGRDVLVALIRRYLSFGRYCEAAILLREAWVSLYGDASANRPGDPRFGEARRSAETRWHAACRNRATVAQLRNDIGHGGFNRQPLPAETIIEKLADLLEALRKESPPTPSPASDQRPFTWLVSRHPGVRTWLEEKGLAIDRAVAHLDPQEIKPGERVIGNLPLGMIAHLQERGVEVLSIALDIPAELRGNELDAATMRALGARLERYRVERLDG